MRIGIIEDDEITRIELAKLLNVRGYETVLFTAFENLAAEFAENSVELLLLDINLPYENGYEVCKKIKKMAQVPVIFVTSRDTNVDELHSIQAGGIDFITKPYDTLILLEKIKRALKLSDPNNFREIVKKDCTLDLHLSILKYKDKDIELTRNEFRILYYFFMNDDKIIGKEELLEKLWNDKYYLDENVLLVNMSRLKKKMRDIGIVHFWKKRPQKCCFRCFFWQWSSFFWFSMVWTKYLSYCWRDFLLAYREFSRGICTGRRSGRPGRLLTWQIAPRKAIIFRKSCRSQRKFKTKPIIMR